jgi:transcriptional regulator with XRE-family HTH domain
MICGFLAMQTKFLDSNSDEMKRARRHKHGRNNLTNPNRECDRAANVGNALHRLRSKHNLTIRQLAQKSGLAVNTLSLIENAKTSPSVATLQQLANALGVPITTFFESGVPRNRVAHVKVADRSPLPFAHGTMQDLGAGLTERTIEPFIVTLKPNANSGSQPIVHTGYEFVFCLEGRIIYTIEEINYLLEPGDSLLFEAPLPHRWQNVETVPARAILVLCSAESRDQPTQRHFLPELLQAN